MKRGFSYIKSLASLYNVAIVAAKARFFYAFWSEIPDFSVSHGSFCPFPALRPALHPLPTRPPYRRSLRSDLDHPIRATDGGTISPDGTVEKDLNLAIARLLCDLLKANGVQTVMTRTEDVLLYDKTVNYIGRKKALDLAARKKIAEETPASVFVSIHMNSFPDPRYRGLQVWYSPNDPASLALAESIQSTVAASLQPDNDRHVKRATSAIYLLHHLHVPAVLVECGFLSSPDDAACLASPAYQKKLALLLFAAIMKEV